MKIHELQPETMMCDDNIHTYVYDPHSRICKKSLQCSVELKDSASEYVRTSEEKRQRGVKSDKDVWISEERERDGERERPIYGKEKNWMKSLSPAKVNSE